MKGMYLPAATVGSFLVAFISLLLSLVGVHVEPFALPGAVDWLELINALSMLLASICGGASYGRYKLTRCDKIAHLPDE